MNAHQFLDATKAMMDALDVAEGLSSHHLECFRFNFHQFVAQMIDEARVKEQQEKYPMGRHDLGAKESIENPNSNPSA